MGIFRIGKTKGGIHNNKLHKWSFIDSFILLKSLHTDGSLSHQFCLYSGLILFYVLIFFGHINAMEFDLAPKIGILLRIHLTLHTNDEK